MVYWNKHNIEKGYKKPISHKKIKHSPVIYTFDTEASSVYGKDNPEEFDHNLASSDEGRKFYKSTEKLACTYIWQFSIDGVVLYGRTIEELKQFLALLNKAVPDRKICYVHNLGYDFQYLMNISTAFEVFARESHKPIKAFCKEFNIEFRCAYFLTNQSLENCAKDYELPVQKLGNFDYTKARHCETPLTDDELLYCEYDCLVLHELIKWHIKEYGKITNIPLTQTSKVRKQLQKVFQKDFNYKRRIKSMSEMTPEVFGMLVSAYMGGYTHANALFTGRKVSDVYSRDESSAYPFVIVTSKLPMSKYSVGKKEHFWWHYKKREDHSIVATISFKGIRLKPNLVNTYISVSRCSEMSVNTVSDNGRVLKSDFLTTTITDVDLEIILAVYDYDEIIIKNYIWCFKGYLDSKFVRFVAEKYAYKTQFKGIPEKASIYKTSKEGNNCIYGMCVTNNIKDEVIFEDGKWEESRLDSETLSDLLTKQNNNTHKILNYAWGVYIAAIARKNLWRMILKVNSDLCYSDTDSIKFVDENNIRLFDEQNKVIEQQLLDACERHNLPKDLLFPKDIKGNMHPLGFWEEDGHYTTFKTYGAKKYCCLKDNGKLEVTVSGLNKHKAVEDMPNGIDDFVLDKVWSTEFSGRTICFYIENQEDFVMRDYLGNPYKVSQPYAVNIMPTTYQLGIADDYEELIENINLFIDNKGVRAPRILR